MNFEFPHTLASCAFSALVSSTDCASWLFSFRSWSIFLLSSNFCLCSTWISIWLELSFIYNGGNKLIDSIICYMSYYRVGAHFKFWIIKTSSFILMITSNVTRLEYSRNTYVNQGSFDSKVWLLYTGKFCPHFILVLFALSPEGEFKTGQIEFYVLYTKGLCRKIGEANSRLGESVSDLYKIRLGEFKAV